ncbi:MAG: UDP-N-acetylenolpyruvoylglucosamine reductase [Planctomycetota bacterium]|nr:MAG: UDP-N-acetylenolpyruvoylglucosamine reductase [Planctomycetota bacterium]
MSIFSGLEKIVRTDSHLCNYTWFGLGGSADYVITPHTVDELAVVIKRCNENDLPFRIIGYGSNLLVRDEGVRGAVIKLEGDEFSRVDYQGETVNVMAGAGLSKLVLELVRKGLGGLEALTGIPGSVGGAVMMNAGGTFGDIGAGVESVTLMDKAGAVFEKAKPELVFDYRQVNITARMILGAKLKLVETDPEQMLRTTKEIWIYKKNSQPLNTRNAGCIFKNPRGLSAGAMIDRAGLKGARVGGAVVSEKHANFIIAEKDCTSSDVLELIDLIRRRVKDEFDIELELELEIW